MQAAEKSVCLMLSVNMLKLFVLLVFQSNNFFLICIPLELIAKAMWKRHVCTGSIDREDVKRDCTEALQPNIASAKRPELEEYVAHHVDRLTMTQGIL